MSQPNTNQGQNPRNQGGYDKGNQQGRTNYRPDQPRYNPKEKRGQDTEYYEKRREGNNDNQGESDPKIRRPYKDNQPNYDNDNYGRNQKQYNRTEGEGRDNYYERKYDDRNRNEGYKQNYYNDNSNRGNFQGEGRGPRDQQYNNNKRDWQEGGYKGDRRQYDKKQNGDHVVNKQDTNKTAETKPAETRNKTTTTAVDNKSAPVQTNKAITTPQSTAEQQKPVQTQQKQEIANKPVSAQNGAVTQPAEVKKENIPSTSTNVTQAQTQPVQAVPTVSYVQGPVGTEQNRLHYTPGPAQMVQVPIVYQVPYIVFPQPNGISMVQPLYQVPSTGTVDKTNTYSLPASVGQPTEVSGEKAVAPQFFGFSPMQPGFMMNPLMGANSMMQPFYFMAPGTTGNVNEAQPKCVIADKAK